MKRKKHVLIGLGSLAFVGFLLAGNNIGQENAASGGSAHADLVVSRIIVERTTASSQAIYGYKYWVAVIIKNAGTTPVTRPFDVTVSAPGYEAGDVQRTNRKFQPNWEKWAGPWIEGGKVIMPGEEIGAAWLYPVYLREMDKIYEVSASVDSNSEIRETDENNNSLTKHYTLYPEIGNNVNVKEVD